MKRKKHYRYYVEMAKRTNSLFVPAKITDRKWADKLMDGEIYMQPLSAFASYEDLRNSGIDSFRGDPYEGISSISLDINSDKVAQLIDEKVRSQIKGIVHIDTEALPFYKLFCLCCVKYNFYSGAFERPDSRMEKFGNTVIVFRDFNSFLERLLDALKKIYGDMFVFLCDHVNYLDLQNPGKVMPVFTKRPDFAYQNELRLAICELDNQNEELHEIKKKMGSLTLNIGSIRDIADEISFEDFFSLRGLIDKSYKFPVSSDPAIETIYSWHVKRTHELIGFNLRNSSKTNEMKSVQRIELVCVNND